jgi:hypothetical protein
MTVVDEFSRQGLKIKVRRSLTTSDLIDVLEKLILEHGRPVCLRNDNGPEMVSSAVQNGRRATTWIRITSIRVFVAERFLRKLQLDLSHDVLGSLTV